MPASIQESNTSGPEPTNPAAGPVDQERLKDPAEVPNEVDGVNTDGRRALDWKSKYEPNAILHIRLDAAYITASAAAVMIAILLTWTGTLFDALTCGCDNCSRSTFDKYAYYLLGGYLGGVLFGIKYLYKVVARSRWHLDRRLWRLLSPLLSAGLALVVGALIESGVLGLTSRVNSGAAYLSYGFLVGYFADRAIDKMHEVAETIFGAPGRKDASRS